MGRRSASCSRLLLHEVNDYAIRNVVQSESGAVFKNLATKDEFYLLGRDAGCCSDLSAEFVDKGRVGSRQGDGEGFTSRLFDADGNAHDGAGGSR